MEVLLKGQLSQSLFATVGNHLNKLGDAALDGG